VWIKDKTAIDTPTTRNRTFMFERAPLQTSAECKQPAENIDNTIIEPARLPTG
jgi:hypothetical protein